jgi:hypothetical protein
MRTCSVSRLSSTWEFSSVYLCKWLPIVICCYFEIWIIRGLFFIRRMVSKPLGILCQNNFGVPVMAVDSLNAPCILNKRLRKQAVGLTLMKCRRWDPLPCLSSMQKLKSLILSRDALSMWEMGQWSELKAASGVAAWIQPEHAWHLFRRQKSHTVRYLSRSEEGDRTRSKRATLRD